ncbi:MAG: cyclic pyranopterin monophosphate synthase MoaC [Saprospiraceae bacterium]|nr:cyclic pyranopterin monophosphate synthase MoaC [Saprospiraceae bacterium]
MENKLSHIDRKGQPGMVDVSKKKETFRLARARAVVFLGEEILSTLENEELKTPKGPVFQTALIAGVMGAKQTGNLIPLCHPIGLDNCQFDIQILDKDHVQIDCTATVNAKTGVEMEALTGASVAALTIYDMCKAMSQDIVIKEVKLIEKRGGKKDYLREG